LNNFSGSPPQAGLHLFRFAALVLFTCAVSVPSRGQAGGSPAKSEWYLSNTAGMALERALSRTVALRQPYCLLIEEPGARVLPSVLTPYYQQSWIVERRILYKDGEESRSQWIFRDNAEITRLVAVFELSAELSAGPSAELSAELLAEGPPALPTGFIELYGANGLIESERQIFEGGEELLVDYQYRQIPLGTRMFLIRADTRKKSPDGEGNERQEDLYTDYYRYTRNYSLRAIERIYHQNDGAEPAEAPLALRFPRRSLDSKNETLFVAPAIAYGSQFLEDVEAEAPRQIIYDTDDRGRILGETRRGEEGNVIAELRNEWSENRLDRIVYSADGDERITEYEYNNAGDRILERNFRNGILERVVHVSGNTEVEELYMNGELVLRTYWEGGRRLREERIRHTRSVPGGS
jgi:antitoxin component YwqK of YwqJK toxin-antitoxin module